MFEERPHVLWASKDSRYHHEGAELWGYSARQVEPGKRSWGQKQGNYLIDGPHRKLTGRQEGADRRQHCQPPWQSRTAAPAPAWCIPSPQNRSQEEDRCSQYGENVNERRVAPDEAG